VRTKTIYKREKKQRKRELGAYVCSEHESESFERIVLVFLGLGTIERLRTKKAARESKT